MKKFSKINESANFDKSDIDKVNDILSDFKDDEEFDVKITNMGSNGLSYGIDIPDWREKLTFVWIEIIIINSKRSDNNDFFSESDFFNKNIQNVISHLEDIGKVFHKTTIEYSREYLNGSNLEDRFFKKNCRVNMASSIKIFPN